MQENKTNPKKVVAAGGTSIFAIVFLMMLIYIVFDGKIPTITLPISFPVTIPTQPIAPVSNPIIPISYVPPVSFTSPTSYP